MSGRRARGAATRRTAGGRAVRETAAPPRRTKTKPAGSPAAGAQDYQVVALVLQGGGALGSYQCGVYEGMHAAGVRPNWFAGTSIGAINAAILAGNAPEHRVERLREFWNTICEPVGSYGPAAAVVRSALAWLPASHALAAWANTVGAFGALTYGQRGFFSPRAQPPFLFRDGSAKATSFYDTAPLKASLERFVDFDRINDDDGVRLSIGATNVANGNFRYFDSTRDRIRPEHVMASGALPPAFPAVEVDGEAYWDGGLVSNTPLDHVLTSTPRRDSLVFQVDLWSARGDLPRTLMDVLERQKDVQFSSRTRFGTDAVARLQETAQRDRRTAARGAQGAPRAGTDGRAGAVDLRSRVQHRAPDLPGQAVRGAVQGLRVRLRHDAGALGGGAGRHAANARAPGILRQARSRRRRGHARRAPPRRGEAAQAVAGCAAPASAR